MSANAASSSSQSGANFANYNIIDESIDSKTITELNIEIGVLKNIIDSMEEDSLCDELVLLEHKKRLNTLERHLEFEIVSQDADLSAPKKIEKTYQSGHSAPKKIEKTYRAGANYNSRASAPGFTYLNYNIELGYEIAVVLQANNEHNQDIVKTIQTLTAAQKVPKTIVKPFDKLQFARAMMEFVNEGTIVPDSQKPALIQKLRNTEALILKKNKDTTNTYNTFVFPLPNYLCGGYNSLPKFINETGKKSTTLSMEERWALIFTWNKFSTEQKKHLCNLPIEEQTHSNLVKYFKLAEGFIAKFNSVASIAPPSEEEDFYASLAAGSSSSVGKAKPSQPEPKMVIIDKKESVEEEFDWDM
jgi:hypothetical protein